MSEPTSSPSAPARPAPARPVALVTGASRGLGFAIAAHIGAQGYHVIAVARTSGGLEELDDRIQKAGGSATLAPMDVTDEKAMAYLAQSVEARWGRLDLWVHTAIHAPPLSPAGHVDMKDLDKAMACNARATVALITILEPLLRASGGRALFLDDPRGGEKFFGAYGASKAAQIAYARSWQAECSRLGPVVRIETPRPVATATRGRFFPGEDRATLADIHDEAARLVALI